MKTKAYINSDQADFLKKQTDVEDISELNITATAKKKTGFNGHYSIVFHDSIKNLSLMGLKPNAYKITLYLFSIITMGNIIVNFSQKRIAEDLGLKPANVSRAFKELFEKKGKNWMELIFHLMNNQQSKKQPTYSQKIPFLFKVLTFPEWGRAYTLLGISIVGSYAY